MLLLLLLLLFLLLLLLLPLLLLLLLRLLLLLLLLLVGIHLVFDDSLLCALLTECDSGHAHFHRYLQHFLFTESANYLFTLLQLPVRIFRLFLHCCGRSSQKYWYLQYIWLLVRFLKVFFSYFKSFVFVPLDEFTGISGVS